MLLNEPRPYGWGFILHKNATASVSARLHHQVTFVPFINAAQPAQNWVMMSRNSQ
jgi:hypothetical protein